MSNTKRASWSWALAAACLLTAGCQAKGDSTGNAEGVTTISPSGYFAFHIDPWISLHHFAYHFGREEARDLKLRGRLPISEDDKNAMSPEFRSACAALTDAYRPYIEGSILFDPNTRQVAKELWNGPDALSDPALRDALTDCMPAYQATLWPLHRAASEAFLDRLMVKLETYEDSMAIALAESLVSAWPDAPIRVDLTPYANWAGAYTDDLPPNVTLSSVNEDVGAHAFEMVFHETAHTGDFVASLEAAANTALEAAGMEDERFWHYILFFVTGRVTSEVLGDPDYVPYSEAVGLTERESSVAFYRALNESWDQADAFDERVLLAAKLVAEEQDRARDP